MHKQISQSPYQLVDYYADKGISPFKVSLYIKSYIQAKMLSLSFQVECDDSYRWRSGVNWSDSYYRNWQLWETDVVELYLQVRKYSQDFNAPYYEFQVNPDNKGFVLKTLKPRQITWTPMNLAFETQSSIQGCKWYADMKIDLTQLYTNNHLGDELFGNFHACLGREDKRHYYSRFHIENLQPDFHRPQQFQRIQIPQQAISL